MGQIDPARSPPDYRALGFKTLKRLVERLPGVFLQPGADRRTLRRARCEEDSDELCKPCAPREPPHMPPARPHSVPTPVLMGEIEADLGANLRPERPTPNGSVSGRRADDESADSAVSGAGRTEALEIGGIYAGICSGLAPFGAFVELDRGGVVSSARPADTPPLGLRAKRSRSWSACTATSPTTESSAQTSRAAVGSSTNAAIAAAEGRLPRHARATLRGREAGGAVLRGVEGGWVPAAMTAAAASPCWLQKLQNRTNDRKPVGAGTGLARLALLVERIPGVCLQPMGPRARSCSWSRMPWHRRRRPRGAARRGFMSRPQQARQAGLGAAGTPAVTPDARADAARAAPRLVSWLIVFGWLAGGGCGGSDARGAPRRRRR